MLVGHIPESVSWCARYHNVEASWQAIGVLQACDGIWWQRTFACREEKPCEVEQAEGVHMLGRDTSTMHYAMTPGRQSVGPASQATLHAPSPQS